MLRPRHGIPSSNLNFTLEIVIFRSVQIPPSRNRCLNMAWSPWLPWSASTATADSSAAERRDAAAAHGGGDRRTVSDLASARTPARLGS